MSPWAPLIALSLVDGIFVGYRSAAGQNPRLHKTDYYLRAAWLGLFAALLPSLIVGVYAALTLGHASPSDAALRSVWLNSLWFNPASLQPALYAEYLSAGSVLVWVYGAYASLVLVVLLLWTYPSRKARELSVMLVLGPCTLLRPAWIVAGAVLAGLSAQSPQTYGALLLVVLSQLSLQPLLGRHFRRRFELSIDRWLERI